MGALPASHLRNGKLCRADQIERDAQIAERFVAGETYRELSAAFLISYGTIWAAIRRAKVRLPDSKYGRGKMRDETGTFIKTLPTERAP